MKNRLVHSFRGSERQKTWRRLFHAKRAVLQAFKLCNGKCRPKALFAPSVVQLPFASIPTSLRLLSKVRLSCCRKFLLLTRTKSSETPPEARGQFVPREL